MRVSTTITGILMSIVGMATIIISKYAQATYNEDLFLFPVLMGIIIFAVGVIDISWGLTHPKLNIQEVNQMPTIKEAAQTYEPKRMKNIADLEVVKTDIEIVENEKREDSEGKPYNVSYFIREGEEYRVPATVLEQLKKILEAKPELKTIKVSKTGEGKHGTKYQVIALD